jgi:uncharacterized membrane protein
MTFDDVISDVVDVVEGFGVAIMIIGLIGSFGWYAHQVLARESNRYEQLRRNLGRSILLGLEVLIIGDIIRTIVVEPTLESVAVLSVIVLIRIVLSLALEVEIDGGWPWRRGTTRHGGGADRRAR